MWSLRQQSSCCYFQTVLYDILFRSWLFYSTCLISRITDLSQQFWRLTYGYTVHLLTVKYQLNNILLTFTVQSSDSLWSARKWLLMLCWELLLYTVYYALYYQSKITTFVIWISVHTKTYSCFSTVKMLTFTAHMWCSEHVNLNPIYSLKNVIFQNRKWPTWLKLPDIWWPWISAS